MIPGPTIIVRCAGCAAIMQHATLASASTIASVLWSDGRIEGPMWREPIIAGRCPRCRYVFLMQRATELGRVPPAWLRNEPAQKVVLVECESTARTAVMRVLRAQLSLSLPEAKGIVDSLPARLGDAFGHATTIDLCDALRAVGAVVSCEPVDVDAAQHEVSPSEWTNAPNVEHPSEAELLAFAESGKLTADEERLARLVAWHDGNDPFRRDGARWMRFGERPQAKRNLERLVDLLTDSLEDQVLRVEALRELGRFSEALALAIPVEDAPAARQIRALAAAQVEELSVITIAG